MPSEILAEVQRLPCGLLESIIEYRHIARAISDNVVDPAGWKDSPLRTLAMEVEHELAAEEIARRA